MINWKVRLKSPAFWTGLIGVLATLIISLAQLFGLDKSNEMADNYRDLCLRFLVQLPYDAAYLEEMVRAIRARQS